MRVANIRRQTDVTPWPAKTRMAAALGIAPSAILTAAVFAMASAAQQEPRAETDPSGQTGGRSDAELAHQLANPVSSLISVPFQLNYDCCAGPNDDERFTLNIQPVIPLQLNDRWNLIIRTIVPVIHQDGIDDATGLGDTTQSFFFSPPSVDGLTWAVGPVLFYPSGTDGLSARQWGAGPTALVLKQKGTTTYGILANHIWSVDGAESGPDISSTFLQPFFNYTFHDSTGLTINTEASYDWQNDQWTVPVHAGVSHLYNWGGQRVQLALNGRVYLEGPDGGPDWGLRFVTTLLFPTG